MGRIDIRISGSGGQGTITAAAILGYAAVYAGKKLFKPSPMALKQEVVPQGVKLL